KYKTLKETLASAEQSNTCAAFNEFLERYTPDFELADVPEMEKANGLRTRICQQELRDKEIAELERELRGALSNNECTIYKKLDRERGLNLTTEQAGRLKAAMDQRCASEAKAQTSLRSCLEQLETTGNFCGAPGCYKAFREVLPQEAYFLSHRSESER